MHEKNSTEVSSQHHKSIILDYELTNCRKILDELEFLVSERELARIQADVDRQELVGRNSVLHQTIAQLTTQLQQVSIPNPQS